jgi:membrane-associated phospholipid phosphatase
MKQALQRITILLCAALFCFATSGPVYANNGIEVAGEVLTYLLPAAAGGVVIGYKDGQGALQFVESSALALGSAWALKYTVHEERPDKSDQHSFPSAHSSVAFSSAEFLRKRYGWNYGLPAYVAASFVGFSRVQADQHYVHDVLAGAAIGIGSAYLFTRPYRGWQVQADTGNRFYGIRLSRLW